MKPPQHGYASLEAIDQMKVKYPSSKSSLRNSLNINGLREASYRKQPSSEPFDQVKIKYRLAEELGLAGGVGREACCGSRVAVRVPWPRRMRRLIK